MTLDEDTVDASYQSYIEQWSLVETYVYRAFLVITLIGLSRLFIDTYYFIRLIWSGFRVRIFEKRCHLLDEQQISVIVLPTDLDHMFHMNNSRYNREADFGRQHLMMKCRWLGYVYRRGWKIGLGATTFRFRKSLNLFDTAWLKSKVAYWDDRSLYVEQKFVRKADGFICAVGYSKYTVVGAPMKEVMNGYGFTGEHPEPSSELLAWIEFNKLSSDKLKPKSS